MKKLLSSLSFPEVGLLKSRLEEAGIACIIRNEQTSMAAGPLPYLECVPELWVLHDEDYARTQALLSEWEEQANQPMTAWICPGCGEELEGQFVSCWKCGHEREDLQG